MPYDEADAQAKSNLLRLKERNLRILQSEIKITMAAFSEIFDVPEQDKNPDGTPKFDNKGVPVMIIKIPQDRGTFAEMTPARRNMIFDKAMVEADVILAKTG